MDRPRRMWKINTLSTLITLGMASLFIESPMADYHPSLASKKPYTPYQGLPPKKPYHEYINPKPLYTPKQNCSVLDDVLRAEICVPELSTSCVSESRPQKRLEDREVCHDIRHTECTHTSRSEEIDVCTYTYKHVEQTALAKIVNVEFVKECNTQMVTVCRPQPYYEGNSYGECKELNQESCFNVPKVRNEELEVTLAFPEATRECETRSVTVPEIKCEEKSEKLCQTMPTVIEEEEQSEQCRVHVAEKPRCEIVELVLPKHVCKEILYDDLHLEQHGQHHHVQHGLEVETPHFRPALPEAPPIYKPHFQ